MINNIICPNCHLVTPPWKHCLRCNAPLSDLVNKLSAGGLSQVSNPALEKLAADSSIQMDAHLHRSINRTEKLGVIKPITASTQENESAVIAKVKDLDVLRKDLNNSDDLRDVRIKATIK